MTGNFHLALKQRIDGEGARTFISPPAGDAISFAEFDALSGRIAGAFLAAGARPGDRVLLQAEKSPAGAAAYLAALRAGLVVTPLNTAYTDDETEYFIEDALPSIIIRDPSRMRKGAGSFTLDARGLGTLIDAANHATPFTATAERTPDDLAAILYTSGTTGRSKGAMLTHGNLHSNARALVDLWAITNRDRLIHALPIFHIHGLFAAFNTALLAGAELIFLPAFEPRAVRRAMADATVMMGVPTYYARLLADPGFSAADAAGVRVFISGSAPLSPEVHSAFARRIGKPILERYGMSEAGMIASNPLDGPRIAGTVGYALPGVEIRIRTANGPAAHGEIGSIEVRGPNVFKGYWRQPETSAQAFTQDGWFITGDAGYLSADGRLTISGREKDLIIVGGLNVYPAEIEAALDSIDGVAESAVVGAPHADMGEGVVAFLALRPGAAEPTQDKLDAALARLARFKRPRRFFFIEQLPRNAMGKPQKESLRVLARRAFDDQSRR